MDTANLYKELILEHSKTPRNWGKLDNTTHEAEGFNPLCGDHYFVETKMNGDTIETIHFHGEGCAISKASGSIMSQEVKGKTAEEIMNLAEQFQELIKGEIETINNEYLQSFASLKDFPTRTKCASLVWHTLLKAINKK